MAHRLLRAFYPSLARQGLFFAIIGADALSFDGLASPLMHFSVALVKPADRSWSGVANENIPFGNERREILSGYFDFDFDGQLSGWMASRGEFLNSPRLDQLKLRISDRSSDREVDEILVAANVTFGRDAGEQLVAFVLPLIARLEPFIGKASITDTNFIKSDAAWRLEIRAGSTNRPLLYRLIVEPFEGKVIFIHRD